MMEDQSLDTLFRDAVAAMDTGDVAALERMLDAHPRLARERLEAPGEWLRGQVGGALDSFFQRPYLLWFVAEDPVRTGTLPPNVLDVTRALVAAVRRYGPETLHEQTSHALQLVCWSPVAARYTVQPELIDILLDAGARMERAVDNALVNGHFRAARHLVARGAPLTLGSALCLGRWDDAARLAEAAGDDERQYALVLSALNGRADGVRRALAASADAGRPSEHLYPHASPLHHAVASGSLETVRVLLDAGADPGAVDTAWGGTPLGWAEHYVQTTEGDTTAESHRAVLAYLRER
ncbi:MAG TPA: ankyrin repeat domain-containing protein [Longimicrobium sp.]|nr:ankyrin repeat domain-containing protein [Longimicrobium sp.]